MPIRKWKPGQKTNGRTNKLIQMLKDREGIRYPVPKPKNKKKKKRPLKSKKPCNYSQFLKSNYWQIVRKVVMKRDGWKCVRCGSKKNLCVHHITYNHHFAEHKHLEILETLCELCHKAEHGLT